MTAAFAWERFKAICESANAVSFKKTSKGWELVWFSERYPEGFSLLDTDPELAVHRAWDLECDSVEHTIPCAPTLPSMGLPDMEEGGDGELP